MHVDVRNAWQVPGRDGCQWRQHFCQLPAGRAPAVALAVIGSGYNRTQHRFVVHSSRRSSLRQGAAPSLVAAVGAVPSSANYECATLTGPNAAELCATSLLVQTPHIVVLRCFTPDERV